jgi:hypothetical protein
MRKAEGALFEAKSPIGDENESTWDWGASNRFKIIKKSCWNRFEGLNYLREEKSIYTASFESNLDNQS